MKSPLHILILEDEPSDAEIIQRLLRREFPQSVFCLARNKKSFLQALKEFPADVILSDNSLPTYSSAEALKEIQARSITVPFILVTGTVSEEYAVSIIKAGADDYILKDRLTRLPAAVEAALNKRREMDERKKLEDELLDQKINEKVRIMAAAFESRERERHAIGIELHDNVNQILVGVNLILAQAKANSATSESLIQMSIAHIQQAIQENRKIAHMFVAPDLDNESLLDQIHKLKVTMLESSGIQVEINSKAFDETALDTDRRINLYRIIQEQFTNIVKYAKARHVTVSLETQLHILRMIISDDGIGMDTVKKSSGIGIKNIISRLRIFQGTATIDTVPGHGFTLTVTLPLQEE